MALFGLSKTYVEIDPRLPEVGDVGTLDGVSAEVIEVNSHTFRVRDRVGNEVLFRANGTSVGDHHVWRG